MRRLTFSFCSKKSRSRSLREVTNSPSRPAQGELLELKIIAMVGSSMRSAGSGLGFSRSAIGIADADVLDAGDGDDVAGLGGSTVRRALTPASRRLG